MRKILLLIGLLMTTPCAAQDATIFGPLSPCTAFGIIAGTCIQGPGVLGAATALSLSLSGNITGAFGTTGVNLTSAPYTQTDNTTAVGTVAAAYGSAFGANTFATGTNAVTITNAYNTYFNAPVAGAHTTLTNGWALGADSANVIGQLQGGYVNVTSSTVPANGIYLSATNTLAFSASSTIRFILNGNSLESNGTTGAAILNVGSTGTVPSILPFRGNTNSGLGGGSGVPAMIVSGVGIENWASTGPSIFVIPSDAGTNDNTLCLNSSTSAEEKGSGTLGICLGTSSARFKSEITALIPGLTEILKLKPKSFYLDKAHGDPKKQMYGFIAEDMVSVLPKLVGRDPQGQVNTADYLGVVPVLVHAMQQQEAEIAALKNTNASIRAENDNFNRRLSALEYHRKFASMK